MKLALIVFGVAPLCLAALPCSAQEDPPEPALPARPEVRVSLQARDLPLRAALKQLVARTREEVRVDRDIPDLPVRLNVRDIPLEHAVRLIARHVSRPGAPITYQPTENGFRLLRGELPTAEPENPLRVTVTPRKDQSAPAVLPAPVAPAEGTGAQAGAGEGAEGAEGPTPEIGAPPPVIEGTPEMRGTFIVPDGDIYIIPPFRGLPFRSNVQSFAVLTPEDPKKPKPFRVNVVPKPRSIMPRRSSGIVRRGGSIIGGGGSPKRKGTAGGGGGGIGQRPF